jgi:putative transposase
MADGCPACHKAGWKNQKDNHPTMKQDVRAKEQLKQGNKEGEGAEIFRDFLRGAVREALWELMQEEVEGLCGPRYAPRENGGYRRAGSESGVMYAGGKKEGIVRPRVRRRRENGSEEEVRLESYRQSRRVENIEAEVFGQMHEGVSTRGAGRLSGETISAATASRMWMERSAGKLEELRGRDLSAQRYFGLMLDGVFLSQEVVVIVALGITTAGEKQMLDFAVGSTESYEVAKELLGRLRQRGFRAEQGMLAILDGAPALRKAVREFWPRAVIQHCLVHKERNLYGYLRRADHAECRRLMARLRAAQGEEAGREALGALRGFVGPRNAAAMAGLDEAGDDLIALHLLNVPATLNASLLSTNLIENAILNYRRQIARVSRWRLETDQVARWTATAMLWVEAGFRKIRGGADLPQLLASLQAHANLDALGCVTNSALRAAAPAEQTFSTPPRASHLSPVTAQP